jgi:hypothetical protein
MFPRDVAGQFSREQGCTPAEWERDLPGAVKPHAMDQPAPGRATVQLQGGGCLYLQWHELPPRQIAMVRLPRLQVDFRFEQVDAGARSAFMRHFDLFLQRGGG